RLAAAWRVGRLASSLPGLATDLAADVDHRLAEIPSPSGLSASDLAAELRWTRRVLVSLHAQEALAGALLEEPPKSRTAAGTALAALAEARARGVPDDQAVAAAPVILALTAPSLRGRGRLPGVPSAPRPETDAPAAAGAGPGPEPGAPLLGQGRTSLDLLPATSPPGRDSTYSAPGRDTTHPAPGRETIYPAPTGNGSRPPAPRPPAFEPAGRATPSSAAFTIYATPPARATQATSHMATSQVITTTASQAAPVTAAPQAPTATPQATRLTTAALPPRESLRLRIRWVQELQARLVREVARRLGIAVERVGLLRWAELAAVLDGGALPGDLHARVPQADSPPLPDAFRLADGQVVVAAEHGEGRGDGVRGVSAGRVVGTVWDGTGPRPKDAVLVVRTLDPALAPLLPGLTGLVAQTGSPLSHLAVLAREYGLPAVVGATDAVRRFPPGSRLTVDGTAGDVRLGDAS
ncbi:PEP-utilizing enzyme, partial [Streptomyces viridochromogenes]|uniref:PEP-utilizing enzyme n=1 Tax=Streptomyces viridochromogenes TaxID=1938 RepID=UPI0005674605